jgi:hypothetical protein
LAQAVNVSRWISRNTGSPKFAKVKVTILAVDVRTAYNILMLFAPKRRRSGARVLAILQAFALAAFLVGIRPHGSLASAENVSGRESSLVTFTDYLETISLNQATTALDGQQAESGLASKVLDTAKIDHAFPLNPSDNQFGYRSVISGSSLIRSPPIGSPL